LIACDHPPRRFAHFHLIAHLLDLRGLLFEVGRENLYLLLRDRCLQLLNFEIELGLPRHLAERRAGLRVGKKIPPGRSIDGERAQPSIGIDKHDSGRPGGNRRTEDVVDKAPVTYLPKNTVDTRVLAVGTGCVEPARGGTDRGIAAAVDIGSRAQTSRWPCCRADGVVGERLITCRRVLAAVLF